MRIVMLGSGNVATVFGKLLFEEGHEIVQVFGRNSNNAAQLATAIGAGYITNLQDLVTTAELYLMAVSDDGIFKLASKLRLPGKVIAHTAGSVTKDVLQQVSEHYGVIYPIQSLSRRTNYVPELPLLVDGSDEHTKETLTALANSISGNVTYASDEERLKLHVAAVISSNFTHHLYALTEEFCKAEGIRFQLLQPLIMETAQRVNKGDLHHLQTGPASRNDEETMQKHRQLLQQHPQLLRVYELISASIMKSKD